MPQSVKYTYDANGNLTKDLNKSIASITYNYLNLPTSITKTGGDRVEYSYDASGTKRQQRYYLNGTLTKTTDFFTNFVYENSVPAWVTYDEGRVVLNSNGTANINEAYIKDHLGNVRVVYYLQAGSLKTQQVNSYYPFGMNIKGLTANGSATYKPNEYLYNGKMMQDEMGLGWLDYGARMYDAVLGRWHSVDPLAEKYRRWSPYNYCVDNPIRFIDPDGMSTGWYEDKNGGLTFNKDVHSQKDIQNKGLTGKFKGEQVRGYLKDGTGFAGDANGQYSFGIHGVSVIAKKPSNDISGAANAFCDGFAKTLVAGAVVTSAVAATTVSTSYWGLKAAISSFTQAIVNKDIDLWDVGVDALTIPGIGSGGLNGAVDIKVGVGTPQISVFGMNKSFRNFAIDGASSSIGGSIGGATDNALAPYLNTSTEEVLMQIGTSLPANFLEKGGNKILIEKVK